MTVEKVQATEGNKELLENAMMLNNEVRFAEDGKLLGDSTETAMVSYGLEKGIKKEDLDRSLPLEDKVPFDSERMRMSTLHRDNDKWLLFVKGAPGKVIESL